MSDVYKEKDSFANVKYVVVVGGTVDCSGGLRESLKVFQVLQVGEADLLAIEATTLSSAYGNRAKIIPKSLCIPVNISREQLIESKPLTPELGDLVFFNGKQSWKDREDTQFAGILYEVVYSGGTPDIGKVLVDGALQKVDFSSLLVLQKKTTV